MKKISIPHFTRKMKDRENTLYYLTYYWYVNKVRLKYYGSVNSKHAHTLPPPCHGH